MLILLAVGFHCMIEMSERYPEPFVYLIGAAVCLFVLILRVLALFGQWKRRTLLVAPYFFVQVGEILWLLSWRVLR